MGNFETEKSGTHSRNFERSANSQLKLNNKMASKFLKISIIDGDDFGLLLAAEEIRRNKFRARFQFSLNTFESTRCRAEFRFEKEDIIRLCQALEIPEEMTTSSGLKFTGIEGLLSSFIVTTPLRTLKTLTVSNFRSMPCSSATCLPQQTSGP